MLHSTTGSPKPSSRARWRVGDPVVDRRNVTWTTSKSGRPCLCQNCSRWPPAEKTGRESVLNRLSCPPPPNSHPQSRRPKRRRNWTELCRILQSRAVRKRPGLRNVIERARIRTFICHKTLGVTRHSNYNFCQPFKRWSCCIQTWVIYSPLLSLQNKSIGFVIHFVHADLTLLSFSSCDLICSYCMHYEEIMSENHSFGTLRSAHKNPFVNRQPYDSTI